LAINNYFRQILLLNYLHLLIERDEKEVFLDIFNREETIKTMSLVETGVITYPTNRLEDIKLFNYKCHELAY